MLIIFRGKSLRNLRAIRSSIKFEIQFFNIF